MSSKSTPQTCLESEKLDDENPWEGGHQEVMSHSVTTGSPRDGVGPEAGRLGLSHWAGPSVTRSAKVSQRYYGGIIIVILTKGKPVPLAWEFIYKLGEVTRVTSTILPDMGRKCVTEA